MEPLHRETKHEAKAALKDALKDLDEGTNPTDLTVNVALESWLKNARHAASNRTWLNRESLYRNYTEAHAIGTRKRKLIIPDGASGF